MPKETKEIKIELDSFKVVICKEKPLEPFSNTFHFKEENLAKSRLGEIYGVIRISDHSEQSAYLPNLLSQVIKREFFSRPNNRNTEESFEATLNKLNLALADLAQHEMTQWIGRIDAIIGAVNQEEFHFTKLGNGKAFLSRNKQISEITAGLNKDAEKNPIKTFLDISSGDLLLNDKLIFTTKEIHASLSEEELERHTKTFTSDEFDNIFKSTLDLEGEDIGAIIINIKKKQSATSPEKKDSSTLNFFGNSEELKKCKKKEAFSKTKNESVLGVKKNEDDDATSKQKPSLLRAKDSQETNSQIETNSTKSNSKDINPNNKTPKEGMTGEVTPQETISGKEGKETLAEKKTGEGSSPFEKQPELFIKEDLEERERQSKAEEESSKDLESILKRTKKALDDIRTSSTKFPLLSKFNKENTVKNIKELSFDNGMSFTTEPSTEKEEAERKEEAEKQQKVEHFRKESRDIVASEEIEEKISSIKETLSNRKGSQKQLIDSERIELFVQKIQLLIKKYSRKIRVSIIRLEKSFLEKSSDSSSLIIKALKSNAEKENPLKQTQEKQSFQEKFQKIKSISGKIVFKTTAKVKAVDWKSLSQSGLEFARNHKKSLSIGALLLFIVFMSAILLTSNKENAGGNLNQILNAADQKGLFKKNSPNEVSIDTVADIKSEIVTITGDKSEVFIYTTEDKFFKLDTADNNLQEIPLKSSIRDIKKIVAMPSLRLIFLVSPRSVFSYSPVMKRFEDVDISLPRDLEIAGVGVYLENLYILDKTQQNILKFPRKPGGFSPFSRRLSEKQVVFSAAQDLTVDDSLLVAMENGDLKQYFKRKLKSSFSIKTDPEREVRIVDVETNKDLSSYFVLDSKNGELLQIDKKDTSKIKTYQNDDLIEAVGLWIDKQKNTAYIGTKTHNLVKIDLTD